MRLYTFVLIFVIDNSEAQFQVIRPANIYCWERT